MITLKPTEKKLLIQSTHISLIFGRGDNQPISKAVDYLQGIIDKANKEGYKEVLIDCFHYRDDDKDYIQFFGIRDENEEERKKRLEKNKNQRESRKRRAKAKKKEKEEEERATLAKLKKKYE